MVENVQKKRTTDGHGRYRYSIHTTTTRTRTLLVVYNTSDIYVYIYTRYLEYRILTREALPLVVVVGVVAPRYK